MFYSIGIKEKGSKVVRYIHKESAELLQFDKVHAFDAAVKYCAVAFPSVRVVSVGSVSCGRRCDA